VTIRTKTYFIFLIIGITNVVFSPCYIDNVLNNPISKAETPYSLSAENNDLYYNLYLPFDAGSMLTNKVERILIGKNTFNEKIPAFFSSFCKKNKNIKHITQYTKVLMQSQQLKTTAVLNCILQI